MKKIRMCVDTDKTFAEGFEEYILDCKACNLRDGTIKHYREAIKQIYKRVPADTLISDLDEYRMPDFIVELRDDPRLNDVSMGTYARDLKTLMRFFMKCDYLPYFEIKIPKADKEAIETYTDDELRRLLRKPDVRKCSFVTYCSWVIVNFLLSSGIRQNSLFNIKIKDIDFDNSLVYVNVTKNRKSLIIPLNEDSVKILQEYLKYRGGKPDDWLFCSIFGEKMTKGANYTALWDYSHSRGLDKTGVHRIGLLLCGMTMWRSKSSGSFAVTLALLPAVVCVVIMMVNGNVGAGVAVAGAFSLVRFRSVPGSAREIGAIFIAMGAGLIAGMGYLAYAALFALTLGSATMLYTALRLGERDRCRTLRITIPEDLDYTGVFDPVLKEYATDYALRHVKTTNMGSLYKLTYDLTPRNPAQEKALIDELRLRNGNLEISISSQAAAAAGL